MAAATQHNLPHGLGLLTTVASLPPKYRSRYLNIKSKSERPLDLSVKSPPPPQIANDVPVATTFTEVYTEPFTELAAPQQNTNDQIAMATATTTATVVTFVAGGQYGEIFDVVTLPDTAICAPVSISQLSQDSKPITPPLTPTKRKLAEYLRETAIDASAAAVADAVVERSTPDAAANPFKLAKTVEQPTTKRECTPAKPIRLTDSAPKTAKSLPPASKSGRNKATRKLKFDEETSSPVSGTIIRPLEDIIDGVVRYSNGDIDPKYNIVEITEETKAELAAIKNVIGEYICRLCRIKFEDAFGLARHRCACIVLLEYRCPECGKKFNCPANLASHRRWHKPKKDIVAATLDLAKKENYRPLAPAPTQAPQQSEELTYGCVECGKRFKRQAYLRKHQLTHMNKGKRTVGGSAQTLLRDESISTTTTMMTTTTGTNDAAGSQQSYAGSSASSMQSYSGTHEATSNYEYEEDSLSDSSSSSTSYGRLQIVEKAGLTEEENIAAAALTNLRNCASVIQHTTLAH